MTMLMGPDVSSYQKYPAWSDVKNSGRSFAWCKSTEGVSYLNPFFKGNWVNMKTSGIIRGTYHFAHPELNTSDAEAQYFLSIVQNLLEPGDLVALDLEEGTGNLLQWTLNFLKNIESQLKFKPLLYSGDWFLGPHGVGWDSNLAEYGLWLSGYSKSTPILPAPWQTLAMWQFTDNDQIPGIAGPVDESYFFGDESQLRKYGMPDINSPEPIILQPDINPQLVTIFSVIGDMTYPDGIDMDAQAPNQNVSRRIFQRQLVQHGKSLLGA